MPSQTRPSDNPSPSGESGQLTSRLANLTPAQRRLLQQKLQNRSSAAEPIAIVGMGCRLPGAKNVDEYWRLIHDGIDATSKIPPSRWDADKYYDPTGETPGKMNVNTMGAVDDVDQFDAKLFGIAPREVFRMDPQQRLLLEVAWETFENAGLAPADVAGTKCGVYVGICGSDYAKVPSYYGDHLKYIDAHIGTGNALSIASGRVSYIYDLKGPSWVVDTACSSALVAVHSAVQAIRNGECESALAGGVNLILTPEIMLALSKAHMLSTTGQVSPFDAGANGYVRGEGCGLVMLKKLTDAVASGDEILGVIRGSHVNQDGKTSGITAPNADSQKECIKAAIAQSGVPIERISYVEAHGTGTPLGDPIEFQSLSQIFRQRSDDDGPVNVTSVKANIGHTETVAGIASLIKVLLLLKHKQIRPQLHLKKLNPAIKLEGTRLNVPTEAMEWKPNGPSRVAGVSSFGFGGTNAHLIVEEAAPKQLVNVESERPLSIVTVSGKSDEAIRSLATAYADELTPDVIASGNGAPSTNGNGAAHKANVHEFGAATTTRRSHFQRRLAVVAPDAAKAAELLAKAADGKRSPAIHTGNYSSSTRPQIGMLFTGQGSQYPDMGRELYESHPVFKASMDRCAEILDPLLDRPLLSVIFPESSDGDEAALAINQTAYTQPALVAIECSLADLWKSWGVVPDVVAGHSVGEYAAAYVAGVLGLEEALQLITHRGRLMQRLPAGGAMAAIMSAPEIVENEVSGIAGDIGIAAYNGPGNTVVSGDQEAVDRIVEKCEAAGLTAKPLTVSHAFHSAHMDPMLDAFRRHADQHQFNVPQIKLISNLDGTVMNGMPPGADYWTEHVRAAVQFTQCGKAMLEEGVDVVIEVGPAPHLTGMMRAIAADLNVDEPAWLPSLRRGKGDWDILLGSVAEAYCNGVAIDWSAFEGPWPRNEVKLPHYPFQRERFWFDNSDVVLVDLSTRNEAVHPILGSPVDAAVENKIYESLIDTQSISFLADHVVQGSCVVPGAAYMDMGLAAAKEMFGEEAGYVESISIQKPLFVGAGAPRQVQTTISPERGGRCTYQVLSRDPLVENDAWTLNVRGTIARGGADIVDRQTNFTDDIASIRERAVDIKTKEAFYGIMAGRSLDYGTAFQGISDLHRTASEAVADLVIDPSVVDALGDYVLHPAMLDCCVQSIAAVVPMENSGDYSPHTYMPVSVQRVDVFAEGTPAKVVAKRTAPDEDEPSPEVVTGDIWILDAEDNLLAEMHGLQVYRVGGGGKGGDVDFHDWMYGVKWESAEKVDPPAVNGRVAMVVAGTTESEAAAELASALESHGIKASVVSDCPETDAMECTDVIVFAAGIGNQGGYERTLTATETLLDSIQKAARSGKSLKLHVITVGGQSIGGEDMIDPTGSALWGMGRVSQMEHPELAPRLIDLEPGVSIADQAGSLVAGMFVGDEDQIAVRGQQIFKCRLRGDTKALSEESSSKDRGPLPVPSSGAFRLRLDGSNSIDGLWIEQTRRNLPEAGQVELEVKAAGLNFSDVLKALGLYPGITDAVVPIGIECSGVVTSVGEGVDRFAVGDRVFGVAPYSFSSHAITNAYALAKLPAGIDDEEAATIPITFLTAYYGMVSLADLQPGERFLIHAGAGGVGIAAIQIAQQIGAEIYATAGSDEKRDFLRDLGVKNLYNSRTLDFADQILADTGQEGVDVILNSLPGEAIDRSIGILGAYGRFLEIGKTDIYSNRMIGLLPFQDNLSYHAIDLDRMLRQRGRTIEKLYDEVLPFFESGDYKPLPMTNFTMPEVRDSFRYMQQRKNIGKVVVSVERDQATIEETSKASGTWLITGGLGGLGLMVADWLIDQGETNIALLGRREPSESAQERIANMTQRGASVVALQGDVTDIESLKKAVAGVPSEFPAITGVMHAAGVLADGVLFDMTPDQLAVPMAAKVLGTLNLEEALADQPLENFVLFSSIAALMGSPGQGNYAAANAFLDGFAADRRCRNLPATVINWGPWAGSGMAVQHGRDDGMAAHGLRLLEPAAALNLMGACLEHDLPQVAAIDAIWGDMLAGQNLAKLPSLVRGAADLIESDGVSSDSGVDQEFVTELLSVDMDQRRTRLRAYFAELIGAIMGMEPDEIQADQPLGEMGLDSLMAIELKNTVETRLGVVLPMARFMEGPSLQSLADQVAELVGEEQFVAAIGSTESDDAGQTTFDGKHELSAGQRALWFIHQLAPESTAYNIAGAIRVHGPLCQDALQQSFAEVVKRHDSYRTTFISDNGKPYAHVQPDASFKVKQIDAVGWSEEQVNECVLDETHRSFDLENGPMIRVVSLSTGSDEHVLVFSVHHIVSDFWSLVACMDQFRQIYTSIRSDATLELEPQTHQYRHFVDWQEEMLSSPEGKKHRDYWHQDLAGELPVLNLPTDRPRPPIQTYRGSLEFTALDPSLTAALSKLANDRGMTLNMVLMAGYQLLLHKITGQDDVLVGLPTSGRSRAELVNIAGYFVNPTAIRSQITAETTLDDYFAQIRKRTLGALEHQDYPLPMLVEELSPERDPSRSTMFQTLFVMQKAQKMHDEGMTPFLMGEAGAKMDVADLVFESIKLDNYSAQFDLSLAASENDGGTSLAITFNTDLFDRDTVATLLARYQRLLRSFVETSDGQSLLESTDTRMLSDLSVLSDAEIGVLTDQWAQGEPTSKYEEGDQPLPVHVLFETQAASTPQKVAVVCGEDSLTYEALNQRANQLARQLQSEGAASGQRVGICLPRETDLVVAMLAVLKTGAAYVPLDPKYPAARLNRIISGTGMTAVVTSDAHRNLVEAADTPILLTGGIDGEVGNLGVEVSGDDMVYVIYTSGSTGDPKGAGVYHRGFSNLVRWYNNWFQIDDSHNFLVVTSHGFDLTQKNFYAPLAVGGQLHLSQTEVFDPEELGKEISTGKITLLNCTPSNLYPILDNADNLAEERLASLRLVVLGGEPIDRTRLSKWQSFGWCNAEVVNSYGPTECSDVVAFHVVDTSLPATASIPLGRAIDGVRLYVLDANRQPVPVGVSGELYVGGICVGAGYINDQEMTEQKFVLDPFAGDDAKMYATGDVCRWLPSGLLEFGGRADYQVKIRGHRIELGEVEAGLNDLPSITEAVAIVREDSPGSKRIVAYVVTNEDLSGEAIAEQLKESLPPQMIPSAIVALDKLPLTPHGKVDRKTLPAPDSRDRLTGAGYVAPRNETEQTIADLWAEILNVEQVGIHDNFFTIGGDSLLAIEAVSRLAGQGVRVSPAQLFQRQSIAELIEVAGASQASAADDDFVGEAPLTPVQQWFYDLELDSPEHFNLAYMLEVPAGLDSKKLLAAAEEIAARHDALRLRMVSWDSGIKQIADATPRSSVLEVVDLSHEQPGDQVASITKNASRIQQSFSMGASPLVRFAYFNLGEAGGRMALVGHHLALDPFSMRLLLEELMTTYMLGSSAVASATMSMRRWAATLAEHTASGGFDSQVEAWSQLADREIQALPVDGDEHPNTVGSATVLTTQFSAAETATITSDSTPMAVPARLLSAITQSLQAQTGHETIRYDFETTGRNLSSLDADLTRTVGWLVSMFPVDISDTNPDSIGRALAAIEDDGISYGALLNHGSESIRKQLSKLVSPEIRFNYLGRVSQSSGDMSDLVREASESTGGNISPENQRTHLIEIDAQIKNDQLEIRWTFSHNRHEGATIEQIARGVKTALTAND